MPGLIPSSRLGKPGRKGLVPSRGCIPPEGPQPGDPIYCGELLVALTDIRVMVNYADVGWTNGNCDSCSNVSGLVDFTQAPQVIPVSGGTQYVFRINVGCIRWQLQLNCPMVNNLFMFTNIFNSHPSFGFIGDAEWQSPVRGTNPAIVFGVPMVLEGTKNIPGACIGTGVIPSDSFATFYLP